MTVEIRVTGAKEASQRLRQFSWTVAALRASDETAPLVTDALRAEAPYRERGSDFSESAAPGYRHLRDSIQTVRHSSVGGTQRTWFSDVPQARFVVEGTRAHDISNRPGSGRTVLSWLSEQSGDRVFVPASRQPVHHPGTTANPFNQRAWESVRRAVTAKYREEVSKEIRG